MQNQFTTLPLAAIAPSLTNPRKSFNPVKLTDMEAEDVVTPMLRDGTRYVVEVTEFEGGAA